MPFSAPEDENKKSSDFEKYAQEALKNRHYELAEDYYIKAWELDNTKGIEGIIDIARLLTVEDPNHSMYLMNLADKLKKMSRRTDS